MKKALLFFIILIGTSSCNDESTPESVFASAELNGVSLNSDESYTANESTYGEVFLEDLGESVRLTVSLTNGTPNYRHAIHLHMGSCEQPGHHWNQGQTSSFCEALNLGEVWARPKAGDVGNINTDSNGNGTLVVESEFWSIGSNDPTDLAGVVIVLHENGEDFFGECFDGDHNHVHMNQKIACGSITLE